MRVFFSILILVFYFQSWTKADDIQDFEIEGMSIGDSLLDYFSKNELENKREYVKRVKVLKDYSKIVINENLNNYASLVPSFKSDDYQYIIEGIAGRNFYGQNILGCYNDMKDISKEIESSITTFEKIDYPKKKLKSLPNGKSYMTAVGYFVNNGVIGIQCYDFSTEDFSDEDRLSIIIFSDKYNNMLNNN